MPKLDKQKKQWGQPVVTVILVTKAGSRPGRCHGSVMQQTGSDIEACRLVP